MNINAVSNYPRRRCTCMDESRDQISTYFPLFFAYVRNGPSHVTKAMCSAVRDSAKFITLHGRWRRNIAAQKSARPV